MNLDKFSSIASDANKKIKNNSAHRRSAPARKGFAANVKFPKTSRIPLDPGKRADLIQKDRGKNFRLFFEILVRLRADFLAGSIASCNV
ncbi:hypothetical protein [Burkholderia arboris]|uniref:hypothetical protein n=1 Tax=Burkholderia arboris TaxID=488730 RepID=UPI001CA403AD|nr:hypothetical protein [Burkholderia arboris]MBY8605097.1 hypothetical protein [Burkholderia arboris]MCA8045709.1 hypothetical protein [Burkholderia arboris]